jgi:hypothetical protein
MGNTVTTTALLKGKRRTILYTTVVSDGTEESDTVIYDSSAIASALGISDPLDCTINAVHAYVSSANAAAVPQVKLEFDANTDVLAVGIPSGNGSLEANFQKICGGLRNYAGTGKTGDITLTTLGLESGDSITLILDVRMD